MFRDKYLQAFVLVRYCIGTYRTDTNTNDRELLSKSARWTREHGEIVCWSARHSRGIVERPVTDQRPNDDCLHDRCAENEIVSDDVTHFPGRIYLLEFMTKAQPFLFDQHFKTLHRPIVWIEQKHCQRCQLRGSVPAVRTVNHNRCAHILNLEIQFLTFIIWFQSIRAPTLSTIRTAPASTHLMCFSQRLLSTADNHFWSSLAGKQISFNFLKLSRITWILWMSKKISSTFWYVSSDS